MPAYRRPLRVRILSDLHLNHREWSVPRASADLVVLSGDITNGTEGIYWARENFPSGPIVYVAGNQECYGHNIDDLIPELRAVAREQDVSFLEQDVLQIDGVRILGATLWTDFNLFGRRNHWITRDAVRTDRPVDRKVIHTSKGLLTPAAMIERHEQTLSWLKAELDKNYDGKTVVVTHHVPTRLGLPPLWRDDYSSAAFASHLDWLFPDVDVWICGHTHTATDFQAGRCRVVINPRGRTVGSQNGFNPELVIEI